MSEIEIIETLRRISMVPLADNAEGKPNSFGKALQIALGIAHKTNRRNTLGNFLVNGTTGRLSSNKRTNLFGKVPDWSVSPFKSSGEFLDAFGEPSSIEGVRRNLNCTVGAQTMNNKQLELRVSEDMEALWEVHVHNLTETPVLCWKASTLPGRVVDRVRPQIMVEARKSDLGFRLTGANVYDNPRPETFLSLIGEGVITVDHLITEYQDAGRIVEKGPLFKIRNSARGRLYGDVRTYSLR